MKRPRQHVLEEESRRALKNLLPSEWIIEDIKPDYGLDVRITIVEGEEVTPKVFSAQIKSTESIIKTDNVISLSINTKYLKYYEEYPLPVFILYYLKGKNIFYYLFAQKYIRETLSVESTGWRQQKTKTIIFSSNDTFKDAEEINRFTTEGAFYVAMSKLNIGSEKSIYWINGIPKSDDKELKTLTLKAIGLLDKYEFRPAIQVFENILKVCTVSPSERTAILVSIGNAFSSLSQTDEALKAYFTANDIVPKLSKSDEFEAKGAIYAGIGLEYCTKSKFVEALEYLNEALYIFRKLRYRNEEAGVLNNISNVYRIQGELTKALHTLRLTLKIRKTLRDLKGQAIVMGNIGNVYGSKENLIKALNYYRLALKIHRKFKNHIAEANVLGSIGTIYGEKNEWSKTLYYLNKARGIFLMIENLEGQATSLSDLAIVYSSKGNTKKAISYIHDSLSINKKIDNKHGEAVNYANLANIYGKSGYLNEALDCLKLAESIFQEVGDKINLNKVQGDISRLMSLIDHITKEREISLET
jgi:tetratricopeptide (TPR) repeat protein